MNTKKNKKKETQHSDLKNFGTSTSSTQQRPVQTKLPFSTARSSVSTFRPSSGQTSGSLPIVEGSQTVTKRPRSASDNSAVSPLSKKTMNSDILQQFSALLETKFSNFSTSIDARFDQLATKDEFAKMTHEIATLKEENNALKAEVAILRRAQASSESRLTYIDRQHRRNNLIIRGIKLSNEVSTQDSLQTLFRDTLKIPHPIPITEFRRMPNNNANSVTSQILVTLLNNEDKWSVLKNSYHLKNTAINISQDYDLSTRNKRGKLLAIRAFLKKQDDNLPACLLKNENLIIENKRYTWDDSVGLIDVQTKAQVHTILNIDLARCINSILTNNGLNAATEPSTSFLVSTAPPAQQIVP